jgi:glutaminyl-peptide cyclotransferase
MRNNFKYLLYTPAFLLAIAACKPDKPKTTTTQVPKETPAVPKAVAPDFSGDTAYMYVQKQVDFGPRVPGTPEHAKCAAYLFTELKKFADNTSMQQAQTKTADNKIIPIKNIIGEFNPQATNRILLFTHWDSRPWADKDTKDKDKPILGANDGGSGVGVLLEVARQLSLKKPNWGVDIIFFDAEDWGVDGDGWCLGSQYWSNNPHKKGYKANYGILLDMVGAPGATFLKEGYSQRYAPDIVQKVWEAGQRLNHYNYFLSADGGGIMDDHFYVNSIAGIKSIDIIHTLPNNNQTFGSFHHTHGDNMGVINKNTLKAVGETLLYVVYNEQ